MTSHAQFEICAHATITTMLKKLIRKSKSSDEGSDNSTPWGAHQGLGGLNHEAMMNYARAAADEALKQDPRQLSRDYHDMLYYFGEKGRQLRSKEAPLGPGERRFGNPRTDEERQLRHGSKKLPPRGAGLRKAKP